MMIQLNTEGTRLLFLPLMGVWIFGIDVTPAVAQETKSAAIDEVLVTGSRVKRNSQDAVVPIMDLSLDDIIQSGDIDLSRSLREIPSIYEGRSTENSQSATSDSGLATVELRNLGDDRTLVLIDGKRTVSNSFTNNSVSLDTIPSGFIDRVEVMTGGASAVYGSDAVTGVINVITRDYYEGTDIGVRTGVSEEGDGEQKQFEITVGTNFHDDRGNILFNYTYDQADAIMIADRGWSTTNIDLDGDISLSSSTPGGRYFGNDWYFDTDTNQLMQGFSSSVNGFDTRQSIRTMRIPKKRNLIAAKIQYALTDNISATFQTQYAHLWTKSRREPDDANSGVGSVETLIPLDNPFIPQPILDQAIAEGEPGIEFRRRFMELGPKYRGGDRDLTRVYLGLEGTIRDNWEWELFYGTHQFRSDQNRVGDISILKFREAVNVEPDPDNPGEYRCVDSRSRLGGCVPLNIFGVGTITPEAAQWIRHRDSMTGENVESQTGFSITGSIAELPAGSLGIAAGIEHREVESSTVWDDIANGGLSTLSPQIDQEGEFEAVEAYVEAVLPVFSGFELEAAYRAADYDMPAVDKTASYRFGFNWSLNDSIRLRALYGTAERAPNVIELYSKGIGNANSINDPCDDVTLVSEGIVDENCRSVQSVLQNIQDNGSFTRDTTAFVFHPLSGNPNLIEETAETLTAGVVFTPSFVEGLALSFDYYDIEIENAIDNFGRQEIVELCFEDPDFDLSNAFCSSIFRDDTTGEIYLVERKQININTLRTKGVDTTIGYNFGLGFMPGDFTFDVKHTYVDTREQDFNAPQGPVTDDLLGFIPYPKDRGTASLRWTADDWKVRWKMTLWGDVKDGAELPDGGVLTVGTWVKNDLYVSRSVDWLGDGPDSRIYFGINNVFDRDPPLLRPGSEYGDTIPTHSSYSIVGRYFYVGLNSGF